MTTFTPVREVTEHEKQARKEWQRQHQANITANNTRTINCIICKVEFDVVRSNQVCCTSIECKRAYAKMKDKERLLNKPVNELRTKVKQGTYKKAKDRDVECAYCKVIFQSNRKNAKYCSPNCTLMHGRELERLKKSEANIEKYKHLDDLPTCLICGHKSITLQSHIISHHKMNVEQYKEQFNVTDNDIHHIEYRKQLQQRVLGEKNPGFNHGGKFSSVSENFKYYDELTEAEKQQSIKDVLERQHITRDINTRLQFYINKGLSIQDAQDAVRKRQATFSLDKCILKYGVDEGRNIWLARQQKWQDTLNSKSNEEKEQSQLEQISSATRKFSKIATELFIAINIPNTVYAITSSIEEHTIKLSSGRYIRPDYIHLSSKKIIEFYGDMWHANPNTYSPTDTPLSWCNINRSALDIQQKDEQRMIELCSDGYEVLIIWESEYKQNKLDIIAKCREFINGNNI